MLALTVACATSLSADFEVSSFSCVDNGLHQRYCPGQAYPYGNSGFVPVRSNLRIKSGELVPRARREQDDTLGLRFEYSIVCKSHNFLHECNKGDVTVYVHPAPKWDRPIPPWQFVIDFIVALIVLSIGGPILLLFCIVCVDTTPNFKRSSFLSDD